MGILSQLRLTPDIVTEIYCAPSTRSKKLAVNVANIGEEVADVTLAIRHPTHRGISSVAVVHNGGGFKRMPKLKFTHPILREPELLVRAELDNPGILYGGRGFRTGDMVAIDMGVESSPVFQAIDVSETGEIITYSILTRGDLTSLEEPGSGWFTNGDGADLVIAPSWRLKEVDVLEGGYGIPAELEIQVLGGTETAELTYTLASSIMDGSVIEPASEVAGRGVLLRENLVLNPGESLLALSTKPVDAVVLEEA